MVVTEHSKTLTSVHSGKLSPPAWQAYSVPGGVRIWLKKKVCVTKVAQKIKLILTSHHLGSVAGW